MLKASGAPAGEIDIESLKRALRDAVLTAVAAGAAAALGNLSAALTGLDMGIWTTVLVPPLMAVLSLGRRWLEDYSAAKPGLDEVIPDHHKPNQNQLVKGQENESRDMVGDDGVPRKKAAEPRI